MVKNIDFEPVFLLVHNFGNSWGEIQNWPPCMEGKERRQTEADHSCLAGFINREAYTRGLSQMATGHEHVHSCLTESQKFIQRPYLGAVPYIIQVISTNTLLSQACILRTLREQWAEDHCKVRRGSGETLVAKGQLTSQPKVISCNNL